MSKTARETLAHILAGPAFKDGLTLTPDASAEWVLEAMIDAGFVIMPKAAQDLLTRLAAMEPGAPSEVDSSIFCFFCSAHEPGEIEPHTKDCIWLNAKNSQRASYAAQEPKP